MLGCAYTDPAGSTTTDRLPIMRLHVGPRIARVHVGGGRRAGLSSGLGPISISGGGRQHRSYSSNRPRSTSNFDFEGPLYPSSGALSSRIQEIAGIIGLLIMFFSVCLVIIIFLPWLACIILLWIGVWWVKSRKNKTRKIIRPQEETS